MPPPIPTAAAAAVPVVPPAADPTPAAGLSTPPKRPTVSGGNVECVRWVTGWFEWLYGRADVLADLTNLWRDKLNAQLHKSEVEVSLSLSLSLSLILQVSF